MNQNKHNRIFFFLKKKLKHVSSFQNINLTNGLSRLAAFKFKKKKKNSSTSNKLEIYYYITGNRIDNVNKWINKEKYLSIIIFPNTASDLVTTQIKSFELDFPNAQFLWCGVLCWLVLHQSLQIRLQKTRKFQNPTLHKSHNTKSTKETKIQERSGPRLLTYEEG